MTARGTLQRIREGPRTLEVVAVLFAALLALGISTGTAQAHQARGVEAPNACTHDPSATKVSNTVTLTFDDHCRNEEHFHIYRATVNGAGDTDLTGLNTNCLTVDAVVYCELVGSPVLGADGGANGKIGPVDPVIDVVASCEVYTYLIVATAHPGLHADEPHESLGLPGVHDHIDEFVFVSTDGGGCGGDGGVLFMTGGGNVTDGSTYTWGFVIHCDGSHANFEFNDHGTNPSPQDNASFHLESLDTTFDSDGVLCTDDGSIDPGQPPASFDTLELHGSGRWKAAGESDSVSADVVVTLADAGEPGDNDTIDITITVGGVAVTTTSLAGGNHQAHGVEE